MSKKTKSNDFSKIGENMMTLMKHCDLDAVQLSKETGLPTSTISRLRTNMNEFSPNISSLIPIARYFEISVSQLIGEEALPDDICGSFKPNNIKKRFIPVIPHADIKTFVHAQSFTPREYIEISLPVSSKTFACYLRGSAMEPQFPEQTLLIVDPEVRPENQDFVLVVAAGKTLPMLRQLLLEGEEKYLRAVNPAFNEFTKISAKNFQILGTLVQSRMSFRHAENIVVNE